MNSKFEIGDWVFFMFPVVAAMDDEIAYRITNIIKDTYFPKYEVTVYSYDRIKKVIRIVSTLKFNEDMLKEHKAPSWWDENIVQ